MTERTKEFWENVWSVMKAAFWILLILGAIIGYSKNREIKGNRDAKIDLMLKDWEAARSNKVVVTNAELQVPQYPSIGNVMVTVSIPASNFPSLNR